MHNKIDMHTIYIAARLSKSSIIAWTVLESRKATTRAHTHLKVSTCLHLSPNIRSRSLSGRLIAVNVSKDTEYFTHGITKNYRMIKINNSVWNFLATQ